MTFLFKVDSMVISLMSYVQILLLIDKDLWECWNILINFACVLFMSLSSRDRFIFSVRVIHFYSHFHAVYTSVLSFSHGLFCVFTCFNFCSFLSTDLSYLKLSKHHCFELSHLQSYATFPSFSLCYSSVPLSFWIFV